MFFHQRERDEIRRDEGVASDGPGRHIGMPSEAILPRKDEQCAIEHCRRHVGLPSEYHLCFWQQYDDTGQSN